MLSFVLAAQVQHFRSVFCWNRDCLAARDGSENHSPTKLWLQVHQ